MNELLIRNRVVKTYSYQFFCCYHKFVTTVPPLQVAISIPFFLAIMTILASRMSVIPRVTQYRETVSIVLKNEGRDLDGKKAIRS